MIIVKCKENLSQEDFRKQIKNIVVNSKKEIT